MSNLMNVTLAVLFVNVRDTTYFMALFGSHHDKDDMMYFLDETAELIYEDTGVEAERLCAVGAPLACSERAIEILEAEGLKRYLDIPTAVDALGYVPWTDAERNPRHVNDNVVFNSLRHMALELTALHISPTTAEA